MAEKQHRSRAGSRVTSEFRQVYGRVPEVLASAPGRVNLIGEHTDYNDGFVLPLAIDRRVWVAAAARRDSHLQLVSLNDEVRLEMDLRKLSKQMNWTDYPLGVVEQLCLRNLPISGVDLLFWGDVPVGSGLSSSAAIEVATATAFEYLFGLELPTLEKITLTRAAENAFVGVPCGIMDQFAAVAAEPNKALFLDCRSLDFEHVRFELNELELVIMDSGVRRELAASAYEQRRAECAEGVRLLSQQNPRIRALRDVSIEEFESQRKNIPESVYRRCRHVITENKRVLDTVAALRKQDLERVGALLYGSHRSLRDDYQVSSDELDSLVDTAMAQDGVCGSRLTGAGFGGCAIALVPAPQLREFESQVMSEYSRRFRRDPQFYIGHAAGGAAGERL